MIDLNSSTSQLNERMPQIRRRSPLSFSHEVPNQSRPTNAGEGMTELRPDKQFHDNTLARSASRSPIRNDRLTPPNIKEPMIELASGKQFHEYLENAKHTVARSSSRSPVRSNGNPRNTCSPNDEVDERGKEGTTRYAISRSRSRSPVSSEVSSKSDQHEVMIELGSGNRTNDFQSSAKYATSRSRANHPEPMIELGTTHRLAEPQRSKSRLPRPDNGTATEAMIDLSSTSRLHERRGTPRMKPLDAMIDLNSADNPASPRSPGFGTLPFSSFPSQVYRPRNRPRYPYKSKGYHGRSQRGTSPALGSPGFSPRLPFGPGFNYPPNQGYRMPGAPMIDLGSLGKSSEFQSVSSSRSSDAPVRSETISKRRYSLDSQNLNEPVKKPRVAGPDHRPETKPGGSGVRLNVSDLLQLETEEQKYIQELSLTQLQVTQIQFKMQRMQQDLEKLQSSEIEIKRSIDVVRAKRVKMLKDAQDHQETQGTSGVLGDNSTVTRRDDEGNIGARKNIDSDKDTRRENGGNMGTRRDNNGDIGTRRSNEDDVGAPRDNEGGRSTQQDEDDLAYNKSRLGFHTNSDDDFHESEPELNKKGSHVYDTEGDSFQEKRDVRKKNSKKSSDKNNKISSLCYAGSSEQSNYRNISNDPDVAPSGLALRGIGHSSDSHHPTLSTNAPRSTEQSYSKFKPTTRHAVLEESPWGTTQEKHLTEIETFESSNGSTITLNSDGTLVLRKSRTETSQLARKRSPTTIVDASRVGFNAKKTEYGGITSDESQQFLGCLEITSTTDEPLVNEDDGPKEVQ